MLQTSGTPTAKVRLRDAWQTLKQEDRNLRTRNAATQLGVSEAELVATGCGTGTDELPKATRLRGEWKEILHAVEELGEVMALTRNDSAVHEKTGRYTNIDINGGMGLVLAGDIDLRLFLRRWHIGFAVQEPGRNGQPRQSLQFFDNDGTAVHKIYVKDTSNAGIYGPLVERFCHQDQSAAQPIEERRTTDTVLDDAAIDVESLRNGWRGLRDTHEFFPLLRRHKVERVQALRLAGFEFARNVKNDSLRRVMEAAAERGVSIMVFVGSPGVIQIHTGPVKRLLDAGPWFNVLDPGFNLHLRECDIASSWVVRKPTEDGDVTSLELFDAANRNIALLFGERKPGKVELTPWRDLLAEVPVNADA